MYLFEGRFGKGYVPVPAERPDGTLVVKQSSRALLGAPGRLPAAWDGLTQYVAEIHALLDQKSTNMCVGFSLAVNIWLAMATMGVKIPLPSMPAIYFTARARWREKDEALVDLGCNPDSAVLGMQDWGVPSLAEWGFDPGAVNDEPDVGVVEGMYDFRIPGHWYIDSTDDAAVRDTMFALSQNMPVSLGTQIDEAFETWRFDPNDQHPITAPDTRHLFGGHMPLLLGYVTRPNGQVWFRGLNWWGTDWGDAGFFWADEEWLKRTTDRTVLRVARTGRQPIRRAA